MHCVTTGMLALAFALTAGAAQWTHYTDYTDATAMLSLDGVILGASTRGAFQYDPQRNEWKHWSLLEGLLSVPQRDIATDDAGHVFWLGEDGSLSTWIPASGEWSKGNLEFRDNEDITEVYSIWGGDDRLIVSHSTGLSVLRYLEENDEYLVENNLHRIGDTAAHSPVYAAATCGDFCLAVTVNGVYYARAWSAIPDDWSTAHLPEPLSAVVEAEIVSLETEDASQQLVIRLLDQEDNGALLLFDGNALHTVPAPAGAWNKIASLCDGDDSGEYWVALRDTTIVNGSASSNQSVMYGFMGASSWASQERTLISRRLASVTLLGNGAEPDPWVMTRPSSYMGGLSNCGSGDPEEVFSPNLPGAEEFVDLAIGPDGSLWTVGVAADTKRSGAYQLKDGIWTAWRFPGEYFGNYPTCVEPDAHGGFWMGTWGRGVLRADIETGEYEWFRGDTDARHKLVGFSSSGNDTSYALVTDLMEDHDGNMWIVNHRAYNDSCLVAVPAEWYDDPELPFYRFHYEQGSTTEGIYPAYLATERSGSIWAGVGGKEAHDTSKRLLRLYDVRADVSRLSSWSLEDLQLSDVLYNYGLGDSPGLITAIEVDQESGIWVSTSDGVYYGGVYSGSIQFSRLQYVAGQISENVDCIAVDARNRVWLGSSLGLNVYLQQEIMFDEPEVAEVFNEMIRYQESLRVNRVLIEQDSGTLWVATNYGIFCCEGAVANLGSSPASETLHVYPNPFRPEGGGLASEQPRMRVLQDGLANTSHVAIYDMNGIFVREFSLREIEDGWDGRNADGEFVSPGVYLIVANGDGSNSRGKVVVIR